MLDGVREGERALKLLLRTLLADRLSRLFGHNIFDCTRTISIPTGTTVGAQGERDLVLALLHLLDLEAGNGRRTILNDLSQELPRWELRQLQLGLRALTR